MKDYFCNIDRVLLSLLAGIVVLALFDRTQAGISIIFTLDSLLEMAPFMLLAVLFAAYVKATGSDQIITKVFSGNPCKAIVTAALVGAISPFAPVVSSP